MDTPHAPTTCESSMSVHLTALNSVICTIESTNRTWGLTICKVLKAHLEVHGVPAFSPEKEVA